MTVQDKFLTPYICTKEALLQKTEAKNHRVEAISFHNLPKIAVSATPFHLKSSKVVQTTTQSLIPSSVLKPIFPRESSRCVETAYEEKYSDQKRKLKLMVGQWIDLVLMQPYTDRDTGQPLSIDKETLLNKFMEQFSSTWRPINDSDSLSLRNWARLHSEQLQHLENFAASIAHYDPDLQYFAGHSFILRGKLHKATKFSEAMLLSSGLSKDFLTLVQKHEAQLNHMIQDQEDCRFSLKGAYVMNGYSLKDDKGSVTETPQFTFLRLALQIHRDDMKQVKLLYQIFSQHKMAPPSPALVNAGKPGGKFATCFTLSKPMKSLNDMLKVIKESGELSFGSMGLHFHEVPARAIINLAKMFSQQAQLSSLKNFRIPAHAAYIEPWHAGIEAFLTLKDPSGSEGTTARDMHLALWVPDEFMRRIENDEDWPLFDPEKSENLGLADTYGEEFEQRLKDLEEKGLFHKQIKARSLWDKIIFSEMKTGEPYILFKDAVNRKSNEKNIGIIRGSNLCAEIVQQANGTVTSVCNVMTLACPAFVRRDEEGKPYVDWSDLVETAKSVEIMADRLTDATESLPSERARASADTRATGIGLQGIADALQMLDLEYASDEAIDMERKFYEHLQFGLLSASVEMAKEKGAYKGFAGSPASEGLFQHDLWAAEIQQKIPLTPKLNWETLREDMKKHGLRNSQVSAQAPTAVTAALLGNNEAAEPWTTNLYTRNDVFGKHWVFNRHLVKDLKERGLWSKRTVQQIIQDKGSVQNLNIPDKLKRKYLTVWEISLDPKSWDQMIKHCRARSPFIDQSESFNVFLPDAYDGRKIERSHFQAWREGLKTGMYYLKMLPARDAIQFTMPSPSQELLECSQNERKEEPLLKVDPERPYTLFPLKHMDIWNFKNRAETLHWKADEIEYERDLATFQSLSKEQQHVIKKILAFFSVSDGIVGENLAENFTCEIKMPEAQAMYVLQAAQEKVHEEAYGRLLQHLVEDAHERSELLHSFENGQSKAIRKKVEWAQNHMNTSKPFEERLLGFACLEGIMFSSSFAFIYHLASQNVVMPGLINSNEFIARDEGVHRDFAILLYRNHLKNKLNKEKVHEIIKTSVEVETSFVKESMPEKGLNGMTPDAMMQYVKLVADNLSESLGYGSIYNVKNPFDWMDMIAMESKTSQFARRVTAYTHGSISNLQYGQEKASMIPKISSALPYHSEAPPPLPVSNSAQELKDLISPFICVDCE